MKLRGKQRLWQLPAKLFDQSGHIIGEGSGQTTLSSIQFGLNQTQQEQKKSISACSVVVVVCLGITRLNCLIDMINIRNTHSQFQQKHTLFGGFVKLFYLTAFVPYKHVATTANVEV